MGCGIEPRKIIHRRSRGAGHAFFNVARTAYRPEQALDGWTKVIAIFHKHLAAKAAARAA